MVVNVVSFYAYCRHVVQELRHWKKKVYFPFSRWLTFSECGHCERIFKLHLTLDRLRMAWKGQHINWHMERRCIIKLYSRVTGILVEEHSE